MKVRQWMKHPVHSVKPRDSIQHAREFVERYRVNQLPVTVDGRLVGIVTDRDLRDAFPSLFDTPPFPDRTSKAALTDPRTITVEQVMTSSVTSVGPDDSIADAARLMRKRRIGALPVVDAGRLVGILTRSDVLDGFVDLVELDDMRETGPLATEGPAAPGSGKPASRARRPREHSA